MLFGATAGATEVTCDNEKGSCTISSIESYICECADGSDMGTTMDHDGDADDSMQAATEEDCRTRLAESCPNPPPDPETDCQDAALTVCQSLNEQLNHCEQTVKEITDLGLVKCCNDYEEWQNQMRWLLDCFENHDCDAREGVCYVKVEVLCDGDGCPSGPIVPGLGGMYKDTNLVGEIEASGDGCHQTAPAGLATLLLLVSLAAARRRSL